jgi:hypothetical protein
MISRTEAERLVLERLNRGASEEQRAAIVESIQKPYGWIVLYDSAAYLEKGDDSAAFYGNGPCVVLTDGQIHELGTARSMEEELADFEKEHGLHS